MVINKFLMASRRNLKKAVNNLCFEVIGECLTFLEHTPSLNQENAQLIIADAVELRNKLVGMINHPEAEASSGVNIKAYYRGIRRELQRESGRLMERLNNLPR